MKLSALLLHAISQMNFINLLFSKKTHPRRIYVALLYLYKNV